MDKEDQSLDRAPPPLDPLPGGHGELVRQAAAIGVLALVLLLGWQVVEPFARGIIWGILIVTATIGLERRLEGVFGGRRWPAVTLLVVGFAAFLLIPIVSGVSALSDHGQSLVLGAYEFVMGFARTPPDWVSDIPYLGPRLVEALDSAAKAAQDGQVGAWVGDATRWLFGQVGVAGTILVQVLVALITMAVLYVRADKLVPVVEGLVTRIGGPRGKQALATAAGATRAVALGVVLTAILQAGLAWLGLLVVGAPLPVLLGFLAFLLTLAQLGAGFILVPVAIWLYTTGETGWAIALVIWLLAVVNTVDNVVRPMLIRRGMSLPLELVFLGVIGGLVSLGLVGVFLGPVVIAVIAELVKSWGSDEGAKPTGA